MALKFGQGFAHQIRRRLPAAGNKPHLDEVVLTIAGVKHWLWRAVNQAGTVVDNPGAKPARHTGRQASAA